MKNKLYIIMIILIGTLYCNYDNIDPEATYVVTFQAYWSSTTHPVNFPNNAHWSGLVGATHNNSISFWEIGELASPGIELMAETGGKTTLLDEVEFQITEKTAGSSLSGGSIALSPGSVSLTFNIKKEFPLVTLVSMVAPSPDWFTGVSGLSLIENGFWVSKKEVEIFAYDAGTDSGLTYTSSNIETDPKENIIKIESSPFMVNNKIVAVGKFIFKKQ